MQNDTSQAYKTFYQYVFGNYRYYDTDGIPESVCIALDGTERINAEKLILESLRKVFLDVRVVRAAGNLKLAEAVPSLEKRLAVCGFLIGKELYSSIIWALLKIKSDRQQLSKIIEVVHNRATINGLKKTDAVELLSDFGQEPLVIEALFDAFLGKEQWVSAAAQHALKKIFRDNQKISELFKLHGFMPEFYIRDSIVKRIKLETMN
jgi:hypothetical protein